MAPSFRFPSLAQLLPCVKVQRSSPSDSIQCHDARATSSFFKHGKSSQKYATNTTDPLQRANSYDSRAIASDGSTRSGSTTPRSEADSTLGDARTPAYFSEGEKRGGRSRPKPRALKL